jgi:uncharacterized protein YcfL
MKKIIAATIFTFVLTGCNSTNESIAEAPDLNVSKEQVVKADSSSTKKGTVCRLEKTIGSNVRRTVCRTQAQIEEEKKEAELAQRDMRRQVGGDINESLGRGSSR